MSLNNLSLNPHLLSQLYPNALLETEAAPAAAPQPTQQIEQAPVQVAPPPVSQPAPAPVEPAPIAPVATAAPATPVAPPQPVAYGNTPFLGGNKKGVLVLVSNEGVPFLPDAELEFLSAILSACRLSIADVAIVNLHLYPQPYTALLEQFKSQQVLLMGITPQQVDLPFHFPHFQLQPFDNRTYLSAPPLGQMAGSRDLKMQLWGCLKRMFGV